MPDTRDEIEVPSTWSLLASASFEIGTEDQTAKLREQYPSEPATAEERERLEEKWREFLSSTHIRVATLLKSDTVSFLFGAGASKEAGGVLMRSIPLSVERDLVNSGVRGEARPILRGWLKGFYLAAASVSGPSGSCPRNRADILARRQALASGDPEELVVSLEAVLSELHLWNAASKRPGARLRIGEEPPADIRHEEVGEALARTTFALAQACRLPKPSENSPGLRAHGDLLRKVLARPLNLKRVNLFSLNYDTLVEQAADAAGVVLLDGFVGTVRRVFRPESYDHDLYFPAETTEGSVHRLDRVIHLYKLHGSITWSAEGATEHNPYGIVAHNDGPRGGASVLIYPTPAKVGDSLGMPYAELLRRFAASVVRPQSTLFVVGYSFGDEHINAIIRQASLVPSFTIVIVDREPRSDFVRILRNTGGRRVWVFSRQTLGTFTGFVRHALPDLRDEDIRRSVAAMHRALEGLGPGNRDESNG